VSTPIAENTLYRSFIDKEIRISKLELEDDMMLNETDLTIKDLVLHQVRNVELFTNIPIDKFKSEVFKIFSYIILRYRVINLVILTNKTF
jgi:hypothetical protein